MSEAVSFDSLEVARAAFMLGEVRFKCALCEKEHLSSSWDAKSCLYELNRLVDSGSSHSVYFPQPLPWKLWGHREEFEALVGEIGEDYTGNLKFKFRSYDLAYLALKKEKLHEMIWNDATLIVEQENQRLAELIGVTPDRRNLVSKYLEFCKPGPPLLPLPVSLKRAGEEDSLCLEARDGGGSIWELPLDEIFPIWHCMEKMSGTAYRQYWAGINRINARDVRECLFLSNGVYVLAAKLVGDSLLLFGKDLYYIQLYWADDYQLVEPVFLRYMFRVPAVEEAVQLAGVSASSMEG